MHRPINSLRESFLWWHLGTQANIDQRLGALDRILEREPQVGWALLAKLLPRATSSISHPTAKPQWRDFGDPPADASNRRSQLTYASAIVDRALERVGTDPEQWCAVLNSLRVFNVTQREKVLALLHKIAKASPAAEVKAPLWEVVRDFISRHRAFSNAGWSLPAGTLDQLEAILGQMAPDDPIERSRWRIEEWLPPVASGGEHRAHRKQMVEELRREAVQEILAKEGISGLVKLHRTIRHWYTRIAAIPTQPGFRRILWSSSPGD